MICRKCGAELADNVIRCSNCGIKVNMVCPECKSLNAFGTTFCNNCGFELIKICPNCNSSNVYSATQCRKCQTPLVTLEEPQPELDIVRPISCSSDEPVNNEEITIVTPIHQEDEIITISDDEKEIATSQNEVLPVEQEQISLEPAQIVEPAQPAISHSEEQRQLIESEFEIPTLQEVVDIDVQESLENEELGTLEPEQEQKIEPKQVVEANAEERAYARIDVQKGAVRKTVFTIKSSIDKHIIAVNGPEGCGKSAVLRQSAALLENEGYMTLYGNCTPLSQITSFGFFQDAFLRMMGFPPYTSSSESFVKDFRKSDYLNAFGFLNGNELALFLNMFYPVYKDNFENILENKQLLFSILEKVIKSFLHNSNLVIAIDNFELLDGASYDFLVYLLNKNFFNNRLKLLVAYQENKSIQSYFDMTVDDKIFETICLKKLTKEELVAAVNNTVCFDVENVLPAPYFEEIIQRADGNALKMEQEIAFLFDAGYISLVENEITINKDKKPETSPQSLEELIKLRINALVPSAKNVLFMAAIMGYRFATNILALSVTMPVKKAEKMLDYLKQELFITPVDNFTCEFKSLSIWKLVYQEAKNDPLFKDNSERLYITLRPLILSSNLQKLISCAEALDKKEEFIIWQDTASITAKLGDTNLFVIAQKQCLKILEETDIPKAENVRAIIYEQMGKLLSEKSPVEAVTYLANVLDSEIKANNINKIIDLSGYFVNSCYLTGNYFGAAEAVDAILSNISATNSEVSESDLALIKVRKLKALLSIGNSEQIINLVQEEILPEINKELASTQVETGYKYLLVDAWMLSNTILARAFALQGNSAVFDVLTALHEFIQKYNYKAAHYNTQTDLIEAFVNTTIGNVTISNEILTDVANRYKEVTMEPELLAQWNLVNILNRIFAKYDNDLKADLFEIAAFTNNMNEHFIKNIIKLILGYVLKEEGNIAKALDIFNEQITYFAKEKVAIGALLAWMLIVQISLDTQDYEKALNTATKALEIAQSPKINNFFFTIYFQKYIAEIYLSKGDLISVKMYLEKAIMLAKQYNLKYQLVGLYISYGKYMEEYMNAKQTFSADYVKLTTEMYNKAVLIAKELKISPLVEQATKERTAFRTYCQLNSIEL